MAFVITAQRRDEFVLALYAVLAEHPALLESHCYTP